MTPAPSDRAQIDAVIAQLARMIRKQCAVPRPAHGDAATREGRCAEGAEKARRVRA
jgi:hypothetical protein